MKRDEVRKYRPVDEERTVVAGLNAEGNHLDQLNERQHIYVSKDCSVYGFPSKQSSYHEMVEKC